MPANKATGKQVHPASMPDHEIDIEHLYRNAPVGLAFLDQDLRYVRINQRLADINGKPISEHLGRTLMEVVPKIAETVEPLYRKVIESGEPVQSREVWGETPAEPGIEKHWLVNYLPIKSADGIVLGVNTVVQDITELKEVENKLRESEEKFRTFMDNNPASVYIKDENDRHIYANPAALDSVKKKPDEFIGLTTRDLWPPEVADKLIALDQKVMGGSIPMITEEWRGTGKDDMCWRKDIKFPIKLVSGKKLLGGIAIDITEIKQKEQHLQNAYNEIKTLKKKLEQENISLRKEIELQYRHEQIVGESKKIRETLSQAEQVANTGTTVLISGETGTGKELLANAIHRMSSRRDRPMVMVNCAALPATLVENELFGSEKGAYTGAMGKQVGRFETADGSTLFLDEISEFPYELQAKLLRVLQDGRYEHLGSSRTFQTDVRLIAATNQDLRHAVKEGAFRKDLFYRLNVFPINMPPLRDRRDDIPQLVWFFVKKFSQEMGKTIDRIPRKTMDLLQGYYWPGNIRELKNIIERAMILSAGKVLSIKRLEPEETDLQEDLSLEAIETGHILRVLDMTGWKIKGSMGAAEILGLRPPTLYSRMKKLGIKRNG